MGGTRRAPHCRGGRPVSPYPADRRLRLCALIVGTQHLFVVVRRRSLSGPCVQAPRAGGTSARVQGRLRCHRQACVVGRPVCKPPAERGHGCPCARPLEAATGRSRAVQGERRQRAHFLAYHRPRGIYYFKSIARTDNENPAFPGRQSTRLGSRSGRSGRGAKNCAPPPHCATKPTRGWLQVGCSSKPRLVLAESDPS